MELVLFLIGGRVYTWIESLWRGYTHWSMFILGGICFVIMGLLNEYKIPWHWCLLRQSIVSAVIITIFEFCTGQGGEFMVWVGRMGLFSTSIQLMWPDLFILFPVMDSTIDDRDCAG